MPIVRGAIFGMRHVLPVVPERFEWETPIHAGHDFCHDGSFHGEVCF
jgi:hypothetical protein